MTAIIKLLNLLPALALAGMALTGFENVPGTLAHRPDSRDQHRHLAARLADNIVKHEKKRSSNGRILRRRADGTVCRAKDQSFVAVASSAVTSTPASTTSTVDVEATSSPSVADVTFTDDSATSSSSSEWVQSTSSSSVEAQATAQSLATTTTSSGGGSVNVGSKFGLAWPNGDWAASTDPNYIGNYIGSKASWYYTWSPFSVGSGDSLGLEFVPMLWGPKQVSDWHAQMSQWPSTVENALFFNEPNQVGQCDISAADAVTYWVTDYLPVRASGIRLGGAATTSAPDGLQWVLDFVKACTDAGNSAADCAADFIPLHWYDVDIENFKSYVENFHTQTGSNIWITEYACQNFNGGAQCTDQESWDLHIAIAAWFDEQSYVERYSPFGVMQDMQGVNQNNALMNPDGSITSLGGWYISSA
ncbi:hypothetical protein CNBB2240 [Cryptococcus deneoformans B-3501A]|uniref:Asl1-like glycosyl hydrolase catalytic domain-containing protein n=1 Tax=Cryptococcus deneoformans (strain JEC21 / ATCC MYA-565) TaxID=214684 RepID=Q5KM01_CRYD1|nr:conserved hypothetical protein [Cryptococcus neoformans var. neoformans JEC21]XP_024514225.1 conserved hypothetical protein [Cryptococcus neoformans var. neoformans JEC21]XP_568921.1 conserved hypothetical protein [Cryptococcus neoformans var. neoformans JEC21]XP_777423.1 hypothetical protein CNBB2240 [Cryptococcus neoformans var. neoformans B-3501A]AAW41614.1 conserved hypothetical protein [Cryptococcus neoformans var. neoformans JEC21]ALO60404.1 conserved hypothetical protein [Cryptococcu